MLRGQNFELCVRGEVESQGAPSPLYASLYRIKIYLLFMNHHVIKPPSPLAYLTMYSSAMWRLVDYFPTDLMP